MTAAAEVRGRSLVALCAGLGARGGDARVSGLALDSRRLRPGEAFVALAGATAHGLDHLDDALAAGAAAVIHDADDPRWSEACAARCAAAGAAVLAVPRLAERVGGVAARFHGEPARALEHVVAVTGTDGKTSVSHFIAAMLDEPESPAAVVGTLGYGPPGATRAAGLTTPDALGLQAALAELTAAGVRRLALEASSHGLAQHRLDGTPIEVAVLTRLGRDHLDYHADEADYAAAKARLFAWPRLRAAVLNADDRFGRDVAGRLRPGVRALSYGRRGGDLRAEAVTPGPRGLRLAVTWGGLRREVAVPLLGAFNADNLLAALGAVLALGLEPDDALARAARVRPVPGRMEPFVAPGSPLVVVDYAHNAGALAAALDAVREHVAGEVWCVFGAGGDRDRGKRPLMGAAAARGADRVVVTDDNPRGEDPAAIIAAILDGVPAPEGVAVEHDRGRAIEMALARAGPDDAILVAGKGHERTQVRGDEAIPWSDRDAVARLLGVRGEAGP